VTTTPSWTTRAFEALGEADLNRLKQELIAAKRVAPEDDSEADDMSDAAEVIFNRLEEYDSPWAADEPTSTPEGDYDTNKGRT